MNIRDFNRPIEDVDNYSLSDLAISSYVDAQRITNCWYTPILPVVVAYEILVHYASKKAYRRAWRDIRRIRCTVKIGQGIARHEVTPCSPDWYAKKGLNVVRCEAIRTLVHMLTDQLNVGILSNSCVTQCTGKVYEGSVAVVPQSYLMRFIGTCADIGDIRDMVQEF